jgi:hypothetical protein
VSLFSVTNFTSTGLGSDFCVERQTDFYKLEIKFWLKSK